ncbi:hypothetical protein [Roseateles sp. PN1]|uniref:hypothetical protein n=1 Tax=Roseateles sp. PN1 TaxID=3137372 RepID=UPI0031395DD0
MDAFAQAQAPAQQQLVNSSTAAIKAQQLTAALPAGGGPLNLSIEVQGEPENRLVFSSLRSTAKLAAISLLDPLGSLVWRKTPAELGLTPQADAGRPELGDAIVLPAVRDAAPGRWRLQLEARAGAKGQVLLSYRVLPRFELSLSLLSAGSSGSMIAAGEPLQLVLRGQDYGVPLTNWAATAPQLSLRDSRGELVASPKAEAGARTATGILISDEPGALIARFILPAAGEYRLTAQHQFRATAKPLQAELLLHATAPKAALALSGLRLEQQAGAAGACVRAVLFDFAVNVATAGNYACNISLVGPAGSRMVSGSSLLAAGAGRISVRVSADKLAALGGPLTVLARVGLIRFGPSEAGLVAELQDVALSAEQANELRAVYMAVCRP